MKGLSLGIDVGTTGVRCAVVDENGVCISKTRTPHEPQDPDRVDARAWWRVVQRCLSDQVAALNRAGIEPVEIRRITVDGTSGSMVLTDAAFSPVTRALMYNSQGFRPQAQRLAALVTEPSKTDIGEGSAAARALCLLSEGSDAAAAHLMHQADFIAAHLTGQGGWSDQCNALKTGHDPETGAWPNWFEQAGMRPELLPRVVPSGAALAPIRAGLADELGLSRDMMIHAGTTDSTAAFLACAPLEEGVAVTSLGTTLAVKLVSPTRLDDPAVGLYSHRIGRHWLVGGASNTGGGVLAAHFSAHELERLSAQIDPAAACGLDFYPLLRPGERFPINDPALAPRLEPRPQSDVEFLHGLLEGMARIEARCYGVIRERGGGAVQRLFTAGGGARNPVWTAIRARLLGIIPESAAVPEAAVGAARLPMIVRHDAMRAEPGRQG